MDRTDIASSIGDIVFAPAYLSIIELLNVEEVG